MWPNHTKIIYLNTSINSKLKEKLVSKSLPDDDYAKWTRKVQDVAVWRAYLRTGLRVLPTPRPDTWLRAIMEGIPKTRQNNPKHPRLVMTVTRL
jgi:hypothetical protein